MGDVTSQGRFAELHRAGTFVMPNAWDTGSARLFESLGFVAIATTSSGHAASLGRHDQHVSRDELVEHAASLVAGVSIPLNVDAEHCFPHESGGIAETISRLAAVGVAGVSIEDHMPGRGVVPLDEARRAVAEAVEAARRHGLVLTARSENHLYGRDDIEDTLSRLAAYRDAGADVLYAPLVPAEAIPDVVALGPPVNVLAGRAVPPVGRLAELGVRRISTGGALAFAAYGAAAAAARELLAAGTSEYSRGSLSQPDRDRAFS